MHDPRGEELKREAALRAAEWLEDGIVLGLGTGTTVRYLLEEIARPRESGALRTLHCIPTSRQTADRAGALGIPLSDLSSHPDVDVTIDGADEVDPELNLIKGLGGALLREKIVAAASRVRIIIIDSSKAVSRLGTRSPLPVEVDPFGAAIQPRYLRSLGGIPELRRGPDGSPFTTDGGNQIFDCRFPDGIDNPSALEQELNSRPGVVENGMFIGMVEHVIVASAGGTQLISREASGSRA